MASSSEIHTDRLLLRDFRPSDVVEVFAYQRDPRYLLHTPWEERTESEVRSFVDLMIAWAEESPRTKFQLAIEREGRVIGSCGIRLAAAGEREGEYGCELAPAAWGQGYAMEASRAIVNFGFTSLGLHRIFSSTLAANAAAINLAERLGFRQEGRLRAQSWIRDGWRDSILLAMLETDWGLPQVPGP
ncbi:GNAT family N-acetyltransferase [Pendulispora rubella]|uniref:GNAT family N-acetyltransferase n=1 Tax=Pendulispora rubella TaxID=2741070 RepID=A0ABZ2KXE6_9BACT